MAQATTLRVSGIAETLRALDRELGDNGKVYRQTVKAIKAAGDDAVNRARGYLPADEYLPSGFTYRNNNGWAKSRTKRDRAFPRYEKRSAASSMRVVAAREKSTRTASGWRAGKMFGISIEMRDPAGSIYDVAGNGRSKRQLNKHLSDPRSLRFIRLLGQAWIGDPNWRFHVVLPAVVDTRPEIINKIEFILDQSQARLERARAEVWRAA